LDDVSSCNKLEDISLRIVLGQEISHAIAGQVLVIDPLHERRDQ